MDYILPIELRDCIVASLKVALENLSKIEECNGCESDGPEDAEESALKEDVKIRLTSIVATLTEDLERA